MDRPAVSRTLLEPVNTPTQEPVKSGITESFVKTMMRDYVNFMPKLNARTIIGKLAFEHYNEHCPAVLLDTLAPPKDHDKPLNYVKTPAFKCG